jgi:hypothetical protein
VSAVVRNNPRAQKQLLDGADVLPTLAVLFDHDELGEPVQSRILTVLTDVLEEQVRVVQFGKTNEPVSVDWLFAYAPVPLQAAGHDALLGRLATEGWCHRLKRYLRNAVALDTSQKVCRITNNTIRGSLSPRSLECSRAALCLTLRHHNNRRSRKNTRVYLATS